MEIVKPNGEDFQLEETKASEISKMFQPMLDKMVELEQEYNVISKLERTKENCIKARVLRLKLVKVRTGTAEIHRDLKAFYIKGGKFVDGWKNAQLMAGEGLEDKLMSFEKHYENLEKERIYALGIDREGQLDVYGVVNFPSNLGEMEDAVWANYITGVRESFRLKKEAERKAEEERIAIEKEAEEKRKEEARLEEIRREEERIEQEKIKKENERLKLEAEEAEKIRQAERQKQLDKEAEAFRMRQKEEAEVRELQEAEKKKREEKERLVQEAHEEKLRIEREEKERLEDELRANRIEEARKIEEEQKRQQEELNKGDKDKVIDLVSDLENIKNKYAFKSVKNKKMYIEVNLLIDKIINHIK